ncbi:MAG: ECF transporter S component [Clostridiales bacterium]|nr:ECF transporter S component [Clostridiales bacterium]
MDITMVKTKKVVISGLLIALNLILPQVFHLFGQQAGKILLPMHIGVLIAGLLLGSVWGVGVGVLTPILGFLITGMPPMPMAIFMVFELAAYGGVSGFFIWLFGKWKWNHIVSIYLSLVLSMVVGRLVYAAVLLLTGLIVPAQAPAVTTVFASFLSGLPGIAIQLVFVPLIVMAAEKLIRFDSVQTRRAV